MPMVDITQWRASIGSWNCHCSSTRCRVSDNKVRTNPTITDSVSILTGPAILSIVLVLVLLLVLSGDIELNPGPGTLILSDVFRFLKPHSAKWDDIGRDLNVDWNTREGITKQGPTTTIDHKLEEVIHHWIESKCSEVSWDNLIKVLRELQLFETAGQIENCLLEDENMKAKYNWKRANEVTHPSHSESGGGVCTPHGSNKAVDQHLPNLDHRNQLPKCVKAFRQHYEGYYLKMKTAPVNKRFTPSITEFVDLVFLHETTRSKISSHDKITTLQSRTKGDTKEIIRKNATSTSINDVLADSDKLVLIKGDPGVGKTTLAWELCKGWTEGRLLQTWDIVLLVQLRDKSIREANTLQSLIDPYNTHRGLCEYIQDNNGAGLMLIFDGFDELSDTQKQDSSVFMRLLQGKMLTEASIIVTTRPSAMRLIPEVFINNLDQHIEIHGFEENAINRYIECKFKDNVDIREAFKAYISSQQFILSLMYVPLHCALITDVYEHYYVESKQQFAPKTLTEIYTCFILCLICRNTGKQIRRISELSDDLKPKFTELARTAAMGIENKQYIFDDIDASLFDQFGLLQRVEVATGYFGMSESCSFLHLTLQEYLAAYYWSTQKDISKLFDSKGTLPITEHHLIVTKKSNLVTSHGHWPALQFFCGLTGVKGTSLEPIFEACQIELEKKGSAVTYNYLCLLFESTSNGNSGVISSAFAINQASKKTIESSKEAYVTGYCIARADESVKWKLVVKRQHIKNLIHGIEYGKIENTKGSVIQEITQSTRGSSSDCNAVVLFLKQLGKIGAYLNDLSLQLSYLEIDQLQSSLIQTDTFDLTKVSYERPDKESSPTWLRLSDIPRKVMKALFSALQEFKSLRSVILNCQFSRLITETTVDEHGRAHLCAINDSGNIDEYCFTGPSLSEVNHPPLPHDCCFIPYVVVQRFNSKFCFGFLEHGYEFLPVTMESLLSLPSVIHSRYHLPVITITLLDLDHCCPLLGENFSAVHFYNFIEKKWILLKLKQIVCDYDSRLHKKGFELRILVTPDNIELLMDSLKKTKMKMNFKVVGDSEYLQPLVQFINNDLKGFLEIPKNRPQLAVILDMAGYYVENPQDTIKMSAGDRDLVKWKVSCGLLDQLYLIKHQCSINEVISFEIHGLSHYDNPALDVQFDFEMFKTVLQALHSQSSTTLKEFKLVHSKPSDDEAKVISDGLVNNRGLEVIVFDSVKSGLDLLYRGLISRESLKTLIITDCSTSVHVLIPVVCTGRNLKCLILEKCKFSIDDYQSVLLGLASNSSIEEVALAVYEDGENMIKAIITNILQLQNISYKLIICSDKVKKFDTSSQAISIKFISYYEFKRYRNSFMTIKWC